MPRNDRAMCGQGKDFIIAAAASTRQGACDSVRHDRHREDEPPRIGVGRLAREGERNRAKEAPRIDREPAAPFPRVFLF